MKRAALIISLLSLISISYGQYDFLFQKKSLDLIRSHEDSLKSVNNGYKKTNVAKNYFPTAVDKHDYYPLSYERTNDGFYPELNVSYFYNETDSTLLSTSYEWNIMNEVSNVKTDGDKFETEKKRKKEYKAKYDEVYKYLTSIFGKPQSIRENKNETGYFNKLVWTNEEIKILVLFKFSTQLIYLPGDIKIGSYEIRVKVDYLK